MTRWIAGWTGLWLALVLGAAPGHAQMASLPQEVQAKIMAMGPVLNPDMIVATLDALRPIVKQSPLAGLKITTDMSYGPDARHLLDVYVAQPQRTGMPVVVFIHGGGYVGGAKNRDGIYGNVTAFFARHGMLGVNATYRLAPQHPWPAGAEDVGKVVVWVKAHAAEYGGNPERIVLIGHSAGATHVASYVFDLALHPAGGPGVVGAVLVSGAFRVTKEGLAPNVAAYFGKDESQFANRSPITHVGKSKVPLFIAMAELDPVFLATESLELAQVVCKRDGKCPRFIWLKGHNHISEMASFDTPDRELGETIVNWIGALK